MTVKIFKVKDWFQNSDTYQRKNIVIENSEKKIVNVPIGINENGEIVTEWIYDYLFDEIKENIKSFKVIVRFGKVPQLTVLYNGKLLDHNENAYLYRQKIEELLGRTDIDIVVDGLTEIRQNIEMLAERSQKTNALISTMSSLTGVDLSADFVYSAIMEYVNKCFNEPTDELEEDIHYLEYEELLEKAWNVVLDNNQEEMNILGKKLIFKLLSGEIGKRK